jgi:hypothetical protein
MNMNMDKADKKRFVTDLVTAIKKDVIAKIESGEIPEEWTGHELRFYLADRFADSARIADKRRKPAYKNDVLVRNL